VLLGWLFQIEGWLVKYSFGLDTEMKDCFLHDPWPTSGRQVP